MMKKAYQFILIIFFILILSVSFFWLFRGKPMPTESLVEGRVLGLPENSYPTLKIALDYIQQGRFDLALNLVIDLYTSGSLQNKFDRAIADQFPLRMPLILFSKAVDRAIIQLSYAFTDDNIFPADMTSDIYIIPDLQALIYPPKTIKEEDYASIENRIANYYDLVSLFPNQNFYIYYLEILEFSPINPLLRFFPKADMGQSYSYLEAHLPEEIKSDIFELTEMNDHLEYFFRTDHHWNTNGILKGYRSIYGLLSINYANIPPILEPTSMVPFPDIEFKGTLARKTLYPIQGDDFIGFEADFPECIIKENGEIKKLDFREEYLRGDYSTTPFLGHYGLYFGTQEGIINYDCAVNSDRNILIIGDSHARPLVALIATQYKQTYFMDLRQDENFILTDFLHEYHIEDILIVGGPNVIFLNDQLWEISVN